MDNRAANSRRGSVWHTCPYVDCNDIRCTSRFSLGRIDQAFSVCFGSYRACPMYHRIAAEAGIDVASAVGKPTPDNAPTAHSSTIIVTANGCALPLRPTGT